MSRTVMSRTGRTGALALAACGGGDDKADSTTVVSTPASVPVATAAPSTTAAPASVAPTTAEATTTTAPAVPVMPLTGLPITDPALAQRQALVVKIDNHPAARPQSGLGVADLVYEE